MPEHTVSEHERLSELFRTNRFMFELERKKMIKQVIDSAPEDQREGLLAIQAKIDKRMKGAGSKENRLVLMQDMFWDHFMNVWKPAIDDLNTTLNGVKSNE